MVDDEVAEAVFATIRAIPPGRVMSYGDVAEYVGLRSARQVGQLLASSADDQEELPWHRVLRADGTAAPHIRSEQLDRLRAESVPLRDGRVDMKSARWDGIG